MISILITAWREEKTIAKSIECIVKPEYSGLKEEYELILACPDKETHQEALKTVQKLGVGNHFRFIKDPAKGKPIALNLLMKEAKGDIWIFTDGDVYFGENAVAELLKHFQNPNVAMVTGRPRSADSKNSMMGYFGNLLSDAAHHKRTIDLTENPQGKSLKIVKRRKFFPVSGYIYAMRKTDVVYPAECLVDDAYISYAVHNQGKKIEYEPKAEAFVKYPNNIDDYFKQKKRSTGGYMQLWEYGVVKPETKTRSFWRELEYFWFPLTYAKSLKELIWSLMLYPIRLWLWVQIYFERKILKKDFVRTWVRVESTK
jgi:cellulose synthase/poly-beta-1,6-N-acetylglucosamine synthase-like glycosyltransferase